MPRTPKQSDTSQQRRRERQRFYEYLRLRREIELKRYYSAGDKTPLRLVIMSIVGIIVIFVTIPLVISLVSGASISNVFLSIGSLIIGIVGVSVSAFELYEKSKESRDEK